MVRAKDARLGSQVQSTHKYDDYLKKPELKKKSQQQHQEQFEVVLVDIKKAAVPFNGQIECVKRNLFDERLKYVAITYRWGEINEQITPTGIHDDDDDDDNGDGYLAHITSFSLTDFFELCQYMANEVDLKYIDYVFVDSISVDQLNKDKRKATVRHMSTIYEHATYILAVPDLHLSYLKLSSANSHCIELVRKHAAYIYHLIAGNDLACDDIERIWCYNLLCDKTLDPKHYLIFYRHYLKTKLDKLKASTPLACFYLLDPILSPPSLEPISPPSKSLTSKLSPSLTKASSFRILSMPSASSSSTPASSRNPISSFSLSNLSVSSCARRHVEKYWYLNQTLNKSLLPEVERLEKQYHERPHHVARLYASDYPDTPHRPRQLDLRWISHPWRHQMTTKLQEWDQQYRQTTTELRQAFQFLIYLMKEWSNRAWVISETQIAKNKSGQVPMKFIFLMLRSFFATDRRDSKFIHVFDRSAETSTFQWVDNMIKRKRDQRYQQQHAWRQMGVEFRQELSNRLGKRDYIDMILGSQAKRNEDRFYAILPLWPKYRHHIVSDDTISSWGITNVISVALRLYMVMDDIKDKIRLLHACSPIKGNQRKFTLPSFATTFHAPSLDLFELKKANSSSSSSLHVHKYNIDAINLLAPRRRSSLSSPGHIRCLEERRYRLCLRAKSFYRMTEQPTAGKKSGDNFFNRFYQTQASICQTLHFKTGSLVAVIIYIFSVDSSTTDNASNYREGSCFQLVGDEIKNRWIILRSYEPAFRDAHDYFTGPHSTLTTDTDTNCFYIY